MTRRQLVVPPPPPLPRDDGVRVWRSDSRGRGGTVANADEPRAACRREIEVPGSEPVGLVLTAQAEGLGWGPPLRPGPVGAVHRGRANETSAGCEATFGL